MFGSKTPPIIDPALQTGDEPAVPVRIAVSGAAGRVGYELVFPNRAGGLFGSAQPVSQSWHGILDCV